MHDSLRTGSVRPPAKLVVALGVALASIGMASCGGSSKRVVGQPRTPHTAPLQGGVSLSGAKPDVTSCVGLQLEGTTYRRSNVAATGPQVQAVIVMRYQNDPAVVGAQYVFSPGLTRNENVVVASTTRSLADQSIQFAVAPDKWMLFLTTLDASGGKVNFDIVAQGANSSPVAVDGTTRYQTTMRYLPDQSAVTVTWGTGQTGTFSDPRIGAYWGPISITQIRHPLPTDGDVGVGAVSWGDGGGVGGAKAASAPGWIPAMSLAPTTQARGC